MNDACSRLPGILNVIDLAAVEGVCLSDEAIFAQKVCAIGNCLTQFGTNPSSHLPARDGPAPSRGASSAQFVGNDQARISRPLVSLPFSPEKLGRPLLLCFLRGTERDHILRAGGCNELDHFVVGFVWLHGLTPS